MRPYASVRLAAVLMLVAPFASSEARAFDLPAIVTKPVNWDRYGGQAGAKFGSAVAPAGDVNGDGFGDVLVGAPGWDNGPADAGAAMLYLGSATGLAATPAWTFLGTQGGAAVGSAVGPAGDINFDGYDDFVVGAALFDGPGGVDQGRVWVFLGAALGPSTTPSQTLNGPAAGSQFGFSVATAGNIDADLFDDLIIGAPRFQGTLAAEGRVALWRGTAGGLVDSGWSKVGGAAQAQLGYSVSTAGDLNADGFDDVIVGAPGAFGFGGAAAGKADAYLGSAGGLGAAPGGTVSGFTDSSLCGASVTLIGDVEGDGYADVVVGEPNYGVFFGNRYGRVVVQRGSAKGLSGSYLFDHEGTSIRENYGVAVASAGDLNGDGFGDFVVGADRYPQPSERKGRFEIYLGSDSGSIILDYSQLGTTVGGALGAAVATAGDVDGDGFSDLVIGEPGATGTLAGEGRVILRRGGAWPPSPSTFWPYSDPQGSAWGGYGLAGGLDPTGSTSNLLFIGSPLTDNGFTNNGVLRVAESSWPNPIWSNTILASGGFHEAKLGSFLARGWDVNRDGWEDLLASSPASSNLQAFDGNATIHFGTGSGFEAVPSWKVVGSGANAFLGADIAGGDFNSDGCGDVLVSSVVGATQAGTVRAYYSGTESTPTTPSWTYTLTDGSQFGGALATGDFDADGFTDAAIGASLATNGQAEEGRVYVFFGGPNGLDLVPGWVLESEAPYTYFGQSLDCAGDVNGDGVADLAIGAPNYDIEGAVFIAFGSAARSKPTFTPQRILRPDVPTSGFGRQVCGIGDIDKDGYSDIAVGAPEHSGGQPQEGRVAVHPGSPNGYLATPIFQMESDETSAYFGNTITRCGDMNFDGWPDFAVGSPYAPPGGRVWMFQGGGRPAFRRVAQYQGPTPMTMGGRLNQPQGPAGLLLLFTLRSPGGRARVGLEAQVTTISENWTAGERAVFGPFDTGVPGPWGSALTSTFPWGALPNDLAYRWRTRNVTGSPYFPPGPWAQPRGFETGDHHFRAVSGKVVGVEDAPSGAALRARLTAITPSPFRDVATLRFHAPRAGQGALDVYDARGRHVRRLVDGRIEAGEHVARFDGRDGDGRVVPAGVYFVRWSLDGERDTRKLVRLP